MIPLEIDEHQNSRRIRFHNFVHQAHVADSMLSNFSACSFIFIFIFIARELSPRKPTFPRTDQSGATSTPLKQASTCEVTITKDPPYTHSSKQYTPLNSSTWQTGTSDLVHILLVRAALTFRRNSWSLLISIIFIVVFSAVAWFASPKGENQTYVLALLPTCAQSQYTICDFTSLRARFKTKQLTSSDRSVWRSTLILSAWSCWLMWGTYYYTTIT